MGRTLDRAWVRIVVAVMILHAVTVPMLFFGVAEIVERSNEDIFVSHVRMDARVVADELERAVAEQRTDALDKILDGAILSGRCVYASLQTDLRTYRSSLSITLKGPPTEDFAFGTHADDTYFLHVPISDADRTGTLLLGFDEEPVRQQMAEARQRLLIVLIVYVIASLMMAGWYGWWIMRPLRDLQVAAGKVRLGERDQRLGTTSRLWEVQQLAIALEQMRVELVGANAQLRQEAADREKAQRERGELTKRLQEKKSLESIGTLAGGIAHEFNNVLVPILLYAEDALESLPRNSPVYEDIQQVVKSAQRARRLISDILTFSRGRDSERTEYFDVPPIIADVAAFLGKLVPPSIEIRTSIAPNCPVVRGDPDLLHQLLMNLCVNGFQSMRDRGGRLEISARPLVVADDERVAPGRYLLLTVRDQGHGMDAELLGRIFEPFFTTRDVGDGSGLGLSVVHGIASNFDAKLTVDSAVDLGTSFNVYIPSQHGAPGATEG
jgi:signal transduction histidine kinase